MSNFCFVNFSLNKKTQNIIIIEILIQISPFNSYYLKIDTWEVIFM